MNTRRSLVIALTSLSLLSGCKEIESIPAGLGYAAQDLCARVFVGHDNAHRAKHHYVAPAVSPLNLIWKVDVDHTRQKVTVRDTLTWQRATSVYRKGLGCTKLVGLSRRDLLAQPFNPDTPVPLGSEYWPEGAGGAAPDAESDADSATLDLAFNDLLHASEYNTQAIALAHDGKLIRKTYASGYSDANRFTGWSMSKTVTAIALGVAQQHIGGFSLDDSASRFYPEWRGTPREDITIRHLFNMESGLDWEENYELKSTTTDMFYESQDMAGYVSSLPLAHEPGTHFSYSSGDTLLLSGIIKQLAGGTLQDNYDFHQDYLFEPMGITSAVMQPDVSGTTVGAAHNYMSAEDWLRMGQLVLDRGEWQGQQIVDAAWIDEIARRTSASGGSYGGQVWTYYADPMARYNLPEDIILFHGHQHQLMAVIPSKDLVFLRLGVFTGDESEENFNNSIRPYFTALQRVIEATE